MGIVRVFVVSPDTRSERRLDLDITVQKLKVVLDLKRFNVTLNISYGRRISSSSQGYRLPIKLSRCSIRKATSRCWPSYPMIQNNSAIMA